MTDGAKLPARYRPSLPEIETYSPTGGPTGQADPSPMRKLRRLLHGRVLLLLILAAILGSGGGWFGWSSTQPLYVSEGKFVVEAAQPNIDDPEGEKIPPMLDAYVDLQVASMTDERVLRHAMHLESWKVIGRPPTEENFRDFASRISARRKRKLLISVIANDPEAMAAKAAVDSVMAAFLELSQNQKLERDQERIAQYEEHLLSLRAERDSVWAQVLALTESFGSKDALASQYDTAIRILTETQADLGEVERKLRALGVPLPDEVGQKSEPPGSEEDNPPNSKDEENHPSVSEDDGANGEKAAPDPKEFAGQDQILDSLLEKKAFLVERIRYLREDKNLGENHEEVRDAKHELKFTEERILARLQILKKAGQARSRPITEEDFLLQEWWILTARKKYSKNRVDLLGRKVGDLNLLLGKREQILDEILRYERLIGELKSEVRGKGRISKWADATLPSYHAVDKRFQSLVFGSFGGILLAFLVVLLLGAKDRRIRSSEDLAENLGHLRLLGLVPDLPGDIDDSRVTEAAVHSVHHTRALLQISAEGNGGQVFVVTGPAAGTGKTTLTHLLGLSFAATDTKTLLIDCDFVGRGLTRRFNGLLRRRIESELGISVRSADRSVRAESLARGDGGFLADQFSDLDSQISTARTGQFCREVIDRLAQNGGDYRAVRTDLGRLVRQSLSTSEREQLARHEWVAGTPLSADFLMEPGLLGAMQGDDAHRCIESMPGTGVHVLPLGWNAPALLDTFSTSVIRDVLSQVRVDYGVVIIDTGPIPGSIEASLVASEANATLLVVSRGDQRQMLARSVQHLQSLGAGIAGVVFNRANHRDASSSSAVFSASRRSTQHD